VRRRSATILAVIGVAAALTGCGGGGGKTPTDAKPPPAASGLTVNVIDGDTRAPLPGSVVTPYDAKTQPIAAGITTDAHGRAVLPAGTALAQAISPGHGTDARSIAPGRTSVTIPLFDPALQSPEYGGGPSRTRYVPAVDLPTPSGNPAWTLTGKALLEFPPAVARGVVALTTNKGRIFVLNARTGDRLWTKARSAGEAPIAASPAIVPEENALLVSGMDGQLTSYVLDTGVENWKFSTGRSPIESSPLVSDETAYIGAHNGRLYAVATNSGKSRWTFQAAGAIKGSVAKSGDSIVFGDYSGTISAVSTAGKRIWSTRVGKRLYGGPGISGNTVVIGDVGGAVIAVDLRNGHQLWRHPTGGGGIVYSSPAIAKGSVFIGSYNGLFEALSLATGKRRWAFDVRGRISGSATVVGNVVYTSVLARPGEPNRSFGLDVASGKQLWRGTDGRYSPAVGAGRTLYIVGRTTLYAYRAP
jgi:outer membrane protein assembly factor BamB